MIRASKCFNDEQRQQINAAVVAAEARTSAEIVPVVASASGRYDRAEDVMGLWLAMAAVAIVYAVMPLEATEVGSWGGASEGWKLVVMLAVGVGAFILGAVIASYAWSARRLFTPGKQMREETEAKAQQAFFSSTVWRTASATGVLVYVSLYERRAMILVDQAVHDKLGQETIDAVCTQLTATLAKTDVTTALCDAITTLGEKLEPVLPHQDDDVNELPDGLVVID